MIFSSPKIHRFESKHPMSWKLVVTMQPEAGIYGLFKVPYKKGEKQTGVMFSGLRLVLAIALMNLVTAIMVEGTNCVTDVRSKPTQMNE